MLRVSFAHEETFGQAGRRAQAWQGLLEAGEQRQRQSQVRLLRASLPERDEVSGRAITSARLQIRVQRRARACWRLAARAPKEGRAKSAHVACCVPSRRPNESPQLDDSRIICRLGSANRYFAFLPSAHALCCFERTAGALASLLSLFVPLISN